MKRNRNHRDNAHSTSFFEPLERRQLMSGGELDLSFSGDGMTTVLIGQPLLTLVASDVAVQPDGKTVVVGTKASPGGGSYFAVTRFNVNGSRDRTFGVPLDFGTVLTEVGGHDSEASAVAIQPDGKIVVVGTRDISGGGWDGSDYHSEFAVVRYNSDGSLDKTFDGDGKKTIRVKDSSDAYDVAIQRDGKIVIAGGDFNGGFSTSGYNANSDFAVVRLNSNGSFDGTFGFMGKTTVAMGGWETANAVTIDYTGTAATNPHFGKIILAGSYSDDTATPSYMALARLNSDGKRDWSFDRVQGLPDTGYNIDPFPGRRNSGLNSVLMQPDGKIVVAGYAGDDTAGSNQFALARYDANGKLDKSFGPNGNGFVETGFGGADFGHELIQVPSGDLIVAGTVNGRFALAAYDANGKLDTTFGTGGKVKLDVGNASSVGLASGPDGRMLIAGGNDFTTARLLPQKQKINIFTRMNASEAGPLHGLVTINRDGAYNTPTRVFLNVGGSAVLGKDYSSNLTTVSSIGGGTTIGGSGFSGNFSSGGFSGFNFSSGGLSNLSFMGGSTSGGPGSVIAGGIGGTIGGTTGGVIGPSSLRYIDIPAGQRFVHVPVTVMDDAVLEPVENVIFTLASDASYEVIGDTQATVLITDNEQVHVNFQTANRFPPAGYAADLGHVFGDRGGGLSYGWDADNTAHTRVRGNSASPDFRYDTLNHMQKNGANRKWEIAVPNGLYLVRIVAGDPSNIDSVYRMDLEGTPALSGTPSGDTRWFRRTINVQVNDGRLTLSNAIGAVNNKIAFIDVKSAPVGAAAGQVTGTLPVRLYSSATGSNWTRQPSSLFSDNQIDEPIWI